MGASATFSHQLWGMGNNAGIVVPPEAAETRARRIDKAVRLFAEGKQR